jgi:N-acyl-D-aspartate/D-glutamate deacylase
MREGAPADLVAFDPVRVRDTATYQSPHSFPEGLPHVIVNGVMVLRDGKITAARPGQVLTRQKLTGGFGRAGSQTRH